MKVQIELTSESENEIVLNSLKNSIRLIEAISISGADEEDRQVMDAIKIVIGYYSVPERN